MAESVEYHNNNHNDGSNNNHHNGDTESLPNTNTPEPEDSAGGSSLSSVAPSLNNDVDNGDESIDPDSIREIELIIRASTIDGRRKGACIFCQEYFMDLYLLAELKTISLKVTTVDMSKPPVDFRSKFDSQPPPILIDGDESVLDNEKIERHIMKNIPGGHNLFVSDPETSKVIENIYTKFKCVITARGEKAKKNLLSHLEKINRHLENRKTRYLTCDTLCCFDCELMTRLQHIRVAGKYFENLEIPEDYVYLWRYMFHMYNLDAFNQSCPADQDIIHHYKLMTRAKLSKHEELEMPSYSTSIPDSVLNYFDLK